MEIAKDGICNAAELIDFIRRRAPEYLDLLIARNELEFEQAFDPLLTKAIDQLESNKKNFQTLDEEGLTAVLRAALSIPGLSVTQESNSNGHVDLTIELNYSNLRLKKLAEAKVYRGYAYHVKGLQQLMLRYSTGRETRGLVIAYFKQPDILDCIKRLRAEMDQNLPCNQVGATTDHVRKWTFLSSHKHSSGEQIPVSHVGCNLH